MKRVLLLTAGWIVAALGLYLAVLGLEFTWNAYNWHPTLDLVGGSMLLGVSVSLLVLAMLARASCDWLSRSASLIVSLALVVLGVYTLPAEPLSQGLFGRESPSPVWYRAGRLLIMALPLVFWLMRTPGILKFLSCLEKTEQPGKT